MRERSGTEGRKRAETEVRMWEEVWRGKELIDNIIRHGVTLVCSALSCQKLSRDWKDNKWKQTVYYILKESIKKCKSRCQLSP